MIRGEIHPEESPMHAQAEIAYPSAKALWAGRVLSALIVLFLFANGLFGLTKSAEVQKGFAHLGYPAGAALGIIVTMLACAVVYAIPRSSVLGAILLTGYLGGATACHVRIGEPPFLAVAVGVLVWVALFLRDARLRALLPLRR
jgi:NAD/NADP transhydrogenase beta subunit